MKILVIDDNDFDVELLRDSLSPLAECEMLRLASGQSALEWLNKSPLSSVDLILIDWRLPSSSGDQIATAFLNSDRSGRSTPVAILSCSALPPKIKEQISGLGGLIFEKPMDLEGYSALAAQLVALARPAV